MKVTLEMGKIKYKGEGESADEAIGSLGLDWQHVKSKGDITVSSEGKSYTQHFFLKQLKRIFANKMTRMMWGKRLELLLKEGKESNDNY